MVRLCLVCVVQGHGEEGGRGQGVQRGTHAAPTKPGHIEGGLKLEAGEIRVDEREGRSRHTRGILSMEGGHVGPCVRSLVTRGDGSFSPTRPFGHH